MSDKECIYREDAIKEIRRAAIFNRDAISRDWTVSLFVRSLYGLINRLPAAPVREVRKGKWVWKHRSRGGLRRVTGIDDYGETHTIEIDERREVDDPYCPKCGKLNESVFLNFCPNCGADMREPVADIDVGRKEEGWAT